MFARTLLCIWIVSCVSARVVFDHSRIYDEYDFKSYPSVTIDDLCKDSCHIYASISQLSKPFAANLLIQTKSGFISVADVAAKFDASTNQKLYLEVKDTASLTIVNANSQQQGFAPLVFYVVNQAANYFSTAEVYEADGFSRPQSTTVEVLTLMSTHPFTITQAQAAGALGSEPQEVRAQMIGFDSVGVDPAPCLDLFHLQYCPFPGFTLEVNGPILSLKYDVVQFPNPPGDLSASAGITHVRQLERAGWVGSPGFHGCPDKQPYRSSLYDYWYPIFAEVTNDEPADISVDVVTNSDGDHAVVLTDEDTGVQKRVSDSPKSAEHLNFNTKNLTITWMPDGTGLTYFLVQWNSTVIPH